MKVMVKADMQAVYTREYYPKMDRRRKFWNIYRGLSSDAVGEMSAGEEENYIVLHESRIYNDFPRQLAAKLNMLVKEDAYLNKTARRIEVCVIEISYHSIDILLDIIGVDNKDFANFVLSALEVYTPSVLAESMGNASVFMDYKLMPIVSSIDQPIAVPSNGSDGQQNSATKVWGIVNGTLFVPVLLLFSVAAMIFFAEREVWQEIKSEQDYFRKRYEDDVHKKSVDSQELMKTMQDEIKIYHEHEDKLLKMIDGELSKRASRRGKG